MLTIICGDALEKLRELPNESVQCCVTSPPYWGLRDYGNDGQLGLEKTPEEYVAKMVEVFRKVRRVLRKDGTLWLNLGDSYCDGLKPKDLCGIPWRVAFALQADGWWLRQDIIWVKPNAMPESVTDRCTKSHEYIFLLTKSARYFYDAEAIKEHGVKIRPCGANSRENADRDPAHKNAKQDGGDNRNYADGRNGTSTRNKRSVWTVATAPYPEAHFATYPPDLIKPCILAGTSAKGCCAKCGAPWERIVEQGEPDLEHQRACGGDSNGDYFGKSRKDYGSAKAQNASETKARILRGMTKKETIGWQPTCECERYDNGRSVGSPCEIQPCTVLDPFAGSGTTGAVALGLGRKAILIELNPKYIELIESRCNVTKSDLALA